MYPESLDPVLWKVLASMNGNIDRLETAVKDLNRGTLIRLAWSFERAVQALINPPYQPPDRDYHVARALAAWVVTRGEEVYRAVIQDPSKMPTTHPDDYMLAFDGAVMFAFQDRFGSTIPPMPAGYGS